MEATTDHFKQVASLDIFCGRCSRPMAIQRLRYADPAAGFSSVDYKCLSCGHEEVRPYPAENLAATN
jgi:DNA-directed RNA polymerase subunit RPC12/RpoP